MIERQTLIDEHKNAAVFGCVTFILNDKGEVLTFKELQTKEKSGKVAGDLSALCETREPGEITTINMLRGIHEELGIAYKDIPLVLDLHDIKAWGTGFMPGVWADVFVVKCKDQAMFDCLIGSQGQPDGVEILGWKTPEEFTNSPVRVGVRNILDKFSADIFTQ